MIASYESIGAPVFAGVILPLVDSIFQCRLANDDLTPAAVTI
jgi:hypothetical protein